MALPPFHRRQAVLGALALLLGACGQEPALPPATAVLPPPGLYQIPPGAPVDGRVRMTLTRGAASSRGVLTANDTTTPIVVTGLVAPARAPARLEVVGEAYGLNRRSDFAGTFRDVGNGGARPAGELQLGNDNLVVLRLRPARGAAPLTVAPGGMTVAFGR